MVTGSGRELLQLWRESERRLAILRSFGNHLGKQPTDEQIKSWLDLVKECYNDLIDPKIVAFLLLKLEADLCHGTVEDEEVEASVRLHRLFNLNVAKNGN